MCCRASLFSLHGVNFSLGKHREFKSFFQVTNAVNFLNLHIDYAVKHKMPMVISCKQCKTINVIGFLVLFYQ